MLLVSVLPDDPALEKQQGGGCRPACSHIAAPPAPAALAHGSVLSMVLSWGLRHVMTWVWEWQAVGGRVFAKCWSSQSIHKIQSASVNSHPLFQWWWSAGPCASKRPVPPCFVTSELGACPASWWDRVSRACPSSWPPAGM